MRSIFLLGIIFLCSFTPIASHGENFVSGVIGTGVGNAMFGGFKQLPPELDDWSNPATGATSQLLDQCSVLTEVKLVNAGVSNYLFLGLRNQSGSDLLILATKIHFTFGNSIEKDAAISDRYAEILVKNGSYNWGFVGFPQKSDFRGQTQLFVNIPIKKTDGSTCEIKSSFAKDPSVPDDPRTTISAPNILVSAGLSGSLGGSYLSQLADPWAQGTFFSAGLFSSPYWGMSIEIIRVSFKNLKDPAFFGAEIFGDLSLNDFNIAASRRFFHIERLSSWLNFGVSLLTASNELATGHKNYDKSIIGIGGSYSIDWSILGENNKDFNINAYLGVSLYFRYYPYFNDGEKLEGTVTGFSINLLRLGY